jgi:hypothetical protein
MKEVLTVILFVCYVYFIFIVLIRGKASITLSFHKEGHFELEIRNATVAGNMIEADSE